GTDDKATLVSNVIQLTETQALDSEFKSYRGQLQLIDPDSGDNTQFVFSGKYLGQGFAPGYLDVWPNGTYQFRLNTGTNHHPDDLISSLHAGESMELPYEVETTDGQKLTIMVKVTGEDNQAKIAVTPYSSLNNHVYEDHTSFGNTTSQLSSGGTLQVIDPDHDQAGFIAQTITTAEGGRFNINAQGHWSYNIDNDKVQHLGAGESFQQTFTVESIDGSAKKDITVTVHGTNDVPIVASVISGQTATEDGAFAFSVPAGTFDDIDAKDSLTLSAGSLPGWLSFDPTTGTFTGTPTNSDVGTTQVTVTATDAHGATVSTAFDLVVNNTNDAPTLNPIASVSVDEDGQQATGQLSATDPDTGDSLTYSVASPVAGLTLNADGSYSFDPSNAAYQSLPDGQTQTVTIPVTVTDSAGATDTQNLTITMTGTNDVARISGVDTGTATEDSGSHGSNNLIVSGQLRVADWDSGEGMFTVTGQSNHQAGIHERGTPVAGDHGLGQFVVHANGVWTFIADNTSTKIQSLTEKETIQETFTVHSKDGTAHTITVDIVGTNDTPVVSSSVTLAAGTEDTAVTLTEAQLLANASDVDHGETAQLSVHNLSADHGTITDNKDGTYTFMPDADYNGAVHFTYDVQDPQGATVAASASMSLAAVADTPIVNVDIADTADNVLNASESAAATISGALDPSVASTLDRIEITDGTTTVTVDKANITVAADGTYQTTADLSSLKDGALTVTAHATSHDGTTATSTDTIIKDSVATIHDNNASMNENQPGIHGNLIVDDESGVQVTGGLGEQQGNYGKFVIHANGSYTYTPDARAQALSLNEHQQETFTFTVTDKAGNTATETFQITLTGRNDGPVITNTVSDSQGATVEDGATRVSGQLSASDVDTGDQLSWEVVGSGSNPGKGNYGNLAVVPSTGQWVYRLDQGAHTQALGDGEQKQETFTLRVTDSYGASVEQTVVVTVTGTNDTPVVSSSVTLAAGTEDTAVTLTEAQLLANASDVDHGETAQLSVHNLNVDHGTVTNNRDGTYNFTPDKDYNGEVHFTYDVKDAHGGVTHTGATTNLAAVNDNPDVTPLTDSVSEGADNHHTLNLLVGATDKDGDALTISHLEYAIDGQ
ncbi:hypothetical protein ACS86_18200, partial [Vibrio alginolyticus]